MVRSRFDRLLPCPCCGARPVVLVAAYGYGGTAVRVECTECKLGTPLVLFGSKRPAFVPGTNSFSREVSLDQAREASAALWNRRA